MLSSIFFILGIFIEVWHYSFLLSVVIRAKRIASWDHMGLNDCCKLLQHTHANMTLMFLK